MSLNTCDSFRRKAVAAKGSFKCAAFLNIMEVTNLLDIHTRAELYRWYEKNHDKVSDFWLRINRAEADCPGVVRYVDAVEVALCFGWIDTPIRLE